MFSCNYYNCCCYYCTTAALCEAKSNSLCSGWMTTDECLACKREDGRLTFLSSTVLVSTSLRFLVSFSSKKAQCFSLKQSNCIGIQLCTAAARMAIIRLLLSSLYAKAMALTETSSEEGYCCDWDAICCYWTNRSMHSMSFLCASWYPLHLNNCFLMFSFSPSQRYFRDFMFSFWKIFSRLRCFGVSNDEEGYCCYRGRSVSTPDASSFWGC